MIDDLTCCNSPKCDRVTMYPLSRIPSEFMAYDWGRSIICVSWCVCKCPDTMDKRHLRGRPQMRYEGFSAKCALLEKPLEDRYLNARSVPEGRDLPMAT